MTEDNKTVNTELSIEGMTCASCVRRVEKSIRDLSGVRDVVVNLATHKARIVHDGKLLTDALISSLGKNGFSAAETQFTLTVDDQTDQTDQSDVMQRYLRQLFGVKNVHFNRDNHKLDIVALRGSVSQSDLEQAVSQFGFKTQVARTDRRENSADNNLKRDLIVAIILTLPIVVVEMGSHFIPQFGVFLMSVSDSYHVRVFEFVLATLIVFAPGWRIIRGGLLNLIHSAPDMNSLVAVGTLAAWSYSTIATFADDLLPASANYVYFEASAVVVTLILLGRVLEAGARGRTGDAIRALAQLQPKIAHIMRNGITVDLPIEEIRVGDLISVRAGEKIPVDGVVISGKSSIDESMLSGEAIPVFKERSAPVFAGTINGLGSFTFKAEKIGEDLVIAQIQKLVEEAQLTKLPVQKFVDKVTAWFVPTVFLVALLTFVIWFFYGPDPILPHALVAAVAVLIVACPCAMGLATPTSIMVATGRAAKLGILFRRGDALQTLRDTTLVAFDKTGTLTSGRPRLVNIEVDDQYERTEIVNKVASIERASNHPFALALIEEAKRVNQEPSAGISADANGNGNADQINVAPGFGISGRVAGDRVFVGSLDYMTQNGIASTRFEAFTARELSYGHSVFFAAIGDKMVAALALFDSVKPEAKRTVAKLREMNIDSAIISGDHGETAGYVGRELGINLIKGDLSPQEKVATIEVLSKDYRSVTFVGDGINDAPALAIAQTGIAIGTGTDVAIASADIILMSGDPAGVVNAIALSRAAILNIKQNVFWAFIYNCALIPIAAGLFYPLFGITLSPMLSAAAMAVSSLFVLVNALRLNRFQPILVDERSRTEPI